MSASILTTLGGEICRLRLPDTASGFTKLAEAIQDVGAAGQDLDNAKTFGRMRDALARCEATSKVALALVNVTGDVFRRATVDEVAETIERLGDAVARLGNVACVEGGST